MIQPINDLVCIADVMACTPITPREESQFKRQELGKIRLGMCKQKFYVHNISALSTDSAS